MKEENTTTNPIVGNKATELAMEVWSYIFALENSAKKTLRREAIKRKLILYRGDLISWETYRELHGIEEHGHIGDSVNGVVVYSPKYVEYFTYEWNLALLEKLEKWAAEFTTYEGHVGIKYITFADLRTKIEELKKAV